MSQYLRVLVLESCCLSLKQFDWDIRYHVDSFWIDIFEMNTESSSISTTRRVTIELNGQDTISLHLLTQHADSRPELDY